MLGLLELPSCVANGISPRPPAHMLKNVYKKASCWEPAITCTGQKGHISILSLSAIFQYHSSLFVNTFPEILGSIDTLIIYISLERISPSVEGRKASIRVHVKSALCIIRDCGSELVFNKSLQDLIKP